MLKRSLAAPLFAFALAAMGFAQSTNTGTRTTQTTRTQTTTTKTTPPAAEPTREATPATTAVPGARARRTQTGRAQSGATDPAGRAVRAAFDALLDGIRHADVEKVMSVYWNSPQLVLFNNNGTVTKTWSQVRANRASSYPNLKDVKLDVRDVRVHLLGRDAALVTCLWTQSQTASGAPENATGRLTLVFRRVGADWKVIHAHTSPDAPDPSRLLPSERTEPPPATTSKPRP